MRRTIVVIALIVLVVLAYLAWPITAISRLARAVEARDVATVMSHVDLARVRMSLTEQVMETYFAISGKAPASPLLRGIVVGAAASIADPIVAGLIEPKDLTELLRTGWPTSLAASRPSGVSGLTTANLGSAWRIYSNARYGFRRFEIAVPPSLPLDRRFDLEFRLMQWRWVLTRVGLPQHLRVQLAQLLIKSQTPR